MDAASISPRVTEGIAGLNTPDGASDLALGPDVAGPFRRLDHIAIAVRDTETALAYFCGRLGLKVVHTDVLDAPPLVLTYLDVGNAFVQLIAPRSEDSDLMRWLDEHGEGVHHVCFGVEDVPLAAVALSSADASLITLGQGRGRTSAFVANGAPHGVTIELTEWWPRDGLDKHERADGDVST
jgi:methylmalonyl-CoA/ethylmalonyl-CoA epimerase